MTLGEYLSSKKMRQVEFARLIDMSVAKVSRVVNRVQSPSFDLALKIVSVTEGAVTFEELAAIPTTGSDVAELQSASAGA